MARQHSPNFDITLKVPDSGKLMDSLIKLDDKIQKRIARNATRKGATVMRKAAVARAKSFDDPKTPERIWKNIVVQEATRSSKRVGGVYMRVGVRGGAKKYANTSANRRKGRTGKTYKTLGDKGNPGGDTWYWRFIEFGTSKVGARSFLRKAMAENGQKVFNTIAIEMEKGVAKVVEEVKIK